MSGVITAAVIVAVAAAATTAMTMSAQNAQRKQQAKLADYQAEVANINAINAANASKSEGDDARRASRIRLGEMRAAFGVNGIDMAGSPLDVLQDTAAEGELTAQRKEYAGRVQSEDYRTQSKMSGYEANVQRSNVSSGGSIAFSSLTSGVMAGGSLYASAGGGDGDDGDGGDGLENGGLGAD